MASAVQLQGCPNGTLIDTYGNALSGHRVFVYRRGTTTQVQVWKDSALTITATQPIVTGTNGALPGGVPYFVAGEQSIDFYDLDALDPTKARQPAEVVSGADVASGATDLVPTGGDDTALLTTAITNAGRAGLVRCGPGTFNISSRVTVPDGVNLQGYGNSLSVAVTTFHCTAAGAGIAIEGSGGRCSDFKVDGNAIATKPLSRGTQVLTGWPGSQRTFVAIDAVNSAQDNFTLYASQNDVFIGCNFQDAARDNVYIDQGAGGLCWVRCEVNNPGRYNLRVDNAVAGGPYTAGAAEMLWLKCIFERAGAASTSAIYAHGASAIRFSQCEAYGTTPTGPIIDIQGSSPVVWDGGTIVGSISAVETGVRVGANSDFTLMGKPLVQNLAKGALATDITAFVHIDGDPLYPGVASLYNVSGTGVYETQFTRSLSFVPITFFNASGGTSDILLSIYGSNTFRVTADGHIIWQGGLQLSPPDASWIAPTLLNSWANLGSGFTTAGYRKDAQGYVHAQGVIAGGTTTTGTAILQFPAGYRPGAKKAHGVASNGAGEVRIDTSGNMTVQTASAAYLSLDDIPPFLAEN